MEITLVRHAKAEERREHLEDQKRQLTEKGKKTFQKLIPELAEKMALIEDKKIILWSSSAKRALETAQIVAQGLQIEIDSIHDFIYEGTFEKMSKEVQAIEEETTVFIVGHEPSLSEWTKLMTGENIKIRKGDMLNFRVINRSPLKAELQWVISAK